MQFKKKISFLLLTELISCPKSTLLQTYTSTEATKVGITLKPEANFYCWTMPLKMGLNIKTMTPNLKSVNTLPQYFLKSLL